VSLPLAGNVALVTGGANGIGRATAQRLSDDGASVVVFDRQAADGVDRVGSVAKESDVLGLFDHINAQHGRLDIVVNCAGIQLIHPLLESTLDDYTAVMDANLKGTFLIGREAARVMMRQSPGARIINIASELAYLGRANYSLYCATKGAVLALTRSWAREFAPHILVNAVAPGPTDTAMLNLETLSTAERQREIDSVPLGRIAGPDEIAATIAFLAGPGGDFYTGQCLSPNGGAVMF
jgi:3-oxoacyl-[acyl-carrier protein] reductase